MPMPHQADQRDYFIERARQEAVLAANSKDRCAAAIHLKMSAAYLQRADDLDSPPHIARAGGGRSLDAAAE